MGCCGEREKGPPEHTAKWEFINLSDFKSSSLGPLLAYAWLWAMAMVAIAVYAVDTFTAINLLAFDNWSSQIQPYVAFKYSKWIFSMCIVVSWALCIFEWIRAIRVIRRGGVAESYMDPLAVSLQSMRPQGWKRFLVFKALTASKKRIDYVAFFVYFAFKGAIRVILAEGPRQVVNGLTLYSVMQANLKVDGSQTNQSSPIIQFFLNIKALAEQDDRQAIILASMMFTLVIWVFSALSLIAALVLYILFLWHHIPQRDARLSVYCRRKIDKRLLKIVESKIKAAIEEDNRKREKEEKRAEMKRQKTGELAPPAPPKLFRQPTLPQLATDDPGTDEDRKTQQLARQNTTSTVSTLPLYTSRQPTEPLPRQPTLPDVNAAIPRPGALNRSATQGSEWSKGNYESDAPLLQNAGYAGGDPRGRQSPAPSYYPRNPQNPNGGPPMGRGKPMPNGMPYPGPMSHRPQMDSQASVGQPPRSYTPMSQPGQYQAYNASRQPGQRFPVRPNNESGSDHPLSAATAAASSQDMYGGAESAVSQHLRKESQASYMSRSNGTPAPSTTPAPGADRDAPYGPVHNRKESFSRPFDRRPAPTSTPAPGITRQATYGSQQSGQSSFSRPMAQRQPSAASLTSQHPFAQSSSDAIGRNQPTPQPNSYEMTTRPAYTTASAAQASNGNGGYVAFNPRMAGNTASPSPVPTTSQFEPRRSPPLAVSGKPGQQGSYFGRVEEQAGQRSASAGLTVPATEAHRLTTGYNDILDDYGGVTPGSEYSPSPHEHSPFVYGDADSASLHMHEDGEYRRVSPLHRI